MSEEKISELTEELINRREPLPQDVIEKYRAQGVPEGEIAAAVLARQALAGPEVPESALERSQRRIREMAEQQASRPIESPERPGLIARIRKFFGMRQP